MAFDAKDFLRPDLQELDEYAPPGKSAQALAAELGVPVEQIIKLDANENPYGSSPQAYQALAEYRRYHIYPDADQAELRQALGAHLGISPEHIMAGNGSDELIDLLLKLVINPGDKVINCSPTFSIYSFSARLYRAQVVSIPRRPDFALDVDRVVEGFRSGELAGAKVLFVCSPNNPDGGVTPPADMERLLGLPVLVVLDEAYVDFAGESLAGWATRFPNLVVLRTFSKWLGIAGLRVGYGILPADIARQLWKIKPPFNANVAAQVAALASLQDLAHMEACKERILVERERLLAALQSIPYLQPYPSQANFLLVRVLNGPAAPIAAALERRGILVRHYSDARLADHMRITVGRPEQTELLQAALRDIGSQGGF